MRTVIFKYNSIGNDAAILTVSKFITMLISMITAMLLSRFRSLEEYGTYSQLVIVINLATSIFTLGLPNSINFFLGRSKFQEEKRKFLSIYYTLSTLLCLVMGIVLIVSTQLIVNYFHNQAIKDYVYFLAFFPWTTVTIGSISNVLVVYGKTKKLALFNLINAIIVVLIICIVELFKWSFNQYMLLYLIAECAMTIWAYTIVANLENSFIPKFDWGMIKEIFKFSVPIGLASLVGTLTLECDKLVIGKLMDTETLAIYTNSAKELPFTIIASSLTAVLLPHMARHLKDNKTTKAVELWKTTVELSYIFMAFIVTSLIVFAPQIMTILYSEKYLLGVNIFRIYSAVLILRITYFGMMLNASGKTKFILFSSIITLAVNLILDIVLYYLIGISGPAIATFISIFTAQALQLIETSKISHIPFKNIFPWSRILFHSLINFTWGIITYFVIYLFNIGTTKIDIIICIFSGILITAIYVFCERKNILKLWNFLNSSDKNDYACKDGSIDK